MRHPVAETPVERTGLERLALLLPEGHLLVRPEHRETILTAQLIIDRLHTRSVEARVPLVDDLTGTGVVVRSTNGCKQDQVRTVRAGLTPRPLRRIASGGELSRVMLAGKVVLGNADGVDTLVFDEVDAGVGGSTARALAGVLADLAATHQVIVVTHLAQVAVMADKHYVVSKEPGDVPQTHLDEVTGEARTAEIARMLSGDQSEASLALAKQMLEEARG